MPPSGAKAQPNPGGGWQGPYYVGPDSTGATPVANPGSVLNPYYGALGNLYYSGNTVTYNWGGATARDAEFVYYGSFMSGAEFERQLVRPNHPVDLQWWRLFGS